MWSLWAELLNNHQTVSHCIPTIYIPTGGAQGFCFLHPGANACSCLFFWLQLSSVQEVASSCSFYLNCPNNGWCWTSYQGLVCALDVFSGEVSTQALRPLLNWIVCLSVVWVIYLLRNYSSKFTLANIYHGKDTCRLLRSCVCNLFCSGM